jgi:hypothetical protein
VPRGPGRVGQRGRVHPVRGVLHGQCEHAGKRLRFQRQPDTAWLVRHRGASLSSPLWSAIFADRDGFQGQRAGNANVLLYQMFRKNYHRFFHDITGAGQSPNNNGLFPVRKGYDMATGIGTPIMAPDHR